MIKEEEQSWKSFFIETIILVGVVLCIRFYVFQFFRVSGPSMCPTLNFLNNECEREKGEFIFVNEFSYHFQDPQRGEVIIFKPPNKDVYYVKRVIGVPGDTIEVKNGKLYLSNAEFSDFKLPETFLSALNKDRTKSYDIQKFKVPEGEYLAFGDNRAQSLDARQCFSAAGCNEENSPFLPKKNIKGKAEFVIWPFWKIRWVENEFDEIFSQK